MSASLKRLIILVVVFITIYFFSVQIQRVLGSWLKVVKEKIGIYSATQEYAIQRYVYIHKTSFVARIYNWINEMLIALDLKRVGVSPVGYFTFWSFITCITTIAFSFIGGLSIVTAIGLYPLLLVMVLVTTRVYVSGRIEQRELDVMDAIDLIIPDISNGVVNSISKYMDNFHPSIRPDFNAFRVNIRDRGYSFEDAMYILADSLGLVFSDFAQRAIYYEASGDEDAADMSDIIETNRLRRDLRSENNEVFGQIRVSFMVSAGITFAYGIFIVATDDFSRHFFLNTTVGNLSLVFMVVVVFGVLSYISTIKSRAL